MDLEPGNSATLPDEAEIHGNIWCRSLTVGDPNAGPYALIVATERMATVALESGPMKGRQSVINITAFDDGRQAIAFYDRPASIAQLALVVLPDGQAMLQVNRPDGDPYMVPLSVIAAAFVAAIE